MYEEGYVKHFVWATPRPSAGVFLPVQRGNRLPDALALGQKVQPRDQLGRRERPLPPLEIHDSEYD